MKPKKLVAPLCLSAIALAAIFSSSGHREPVSSITIGEWEPSTINRSPQPQTWRVKPGSVYDGDTLRVVNGSQELKIRFCGIDAPEKDQPLGIESRDYLRSLLKDNSPVQVTQIERDRYGRTVAEIFLGETNINVAMVRAGYAWHYTKYSGSCPSREAIAAAEAAAQAQSVGVHANSSIPPWEWRRRH